MTQPTKYRIVFDLDGTLIHSMPDIHAAMSKMLTEAGSGPLDLATLQGYVGHGLAHLVRGVMAHQGIAADRFDALHRRALAIYSESQSALTRTYPGVIAALTRLTAAGHELAICTNKPMVPTRAVLEQTGIAEFFPVVVAGDTMAKPKPDAGPLLHALDQMGTGASIYIGDSEVDAQTAVNAGVRFGLYSMGYRKSEVAQIAHDAVFDDFDALDGVIAALGAP